MNGAARPLFVAVGSFGAGKTTLVRRLVRQALALGERPAVVVNELGAAGVDETSLAAEGVWVEAVAGGCACCDASAALAPALERAARAGATGAFVEAAGGAAPARFVEAVAVAAAALGYDAPRVIAVVDAQQHERFHGSEALAEALALADVVLLNKIDTRYDSEARSMRAWFASRAPGVAVVVTVEATVELAELGGWRRAAAPARARAGGAGVHAARRVVEIELEAAMPRAALAHLVADPPAGTERGKGFARIDGERGTFTVQIAGRSGAMRACPIEPPPRSRLVFVGETLDESAVRARVLAG